MEKNINNDMNFVDFFLLVKKNIKTIFFSIFFTTSLLILYLFITPILYSSHVSIYHISEDSSIGATSSILKGLVNTIGMNTMLNTQDIYYIPDIIESRRLKKNIINKVWNSKSYSNDINLISYWDIDDEINNISFNWINSFFNKNKENKKEKYIEKAMEKLEKRILFKELDSGLLQVKVLMEEPQMAADIANYIALFVENYIGTDITLKSTKYREFIGNRKEIAKQDLSKSEEKLTLFRKNNPIALDTPDLQLTRLRLIRDLEVNQELYITILTQYEIAKMEESKDKPIINILDDADPAVEKYSPKRLKLLVVSTLLGFIFSLLYIYIKNIYYNVSNN
tara:strand:+ start:223 stop:1236 length:1014 start_codon:yes stop_codon:yes gene_type:complete